MGADLLLATAASPYVTDATRDRFVKWYDEQGFTVDSVLDVWAEVGIERIEKLDLPDNVLEYWESNFEMQEDEPDFRTWVRGQLTVAVRTIVPNYRRDVATIDVGHRADYITGGMSWGDDPTAAFSHVEWLGAVDLYGKPITFAEARRALTRIKERIA